MQFKPGDMVLFKMSGNVAIIIRKGVNMPGQSNNDWVLWSNLPYKNKYTNISDARLKMQEVEVFSASR